MNAARLPHRALLLAARHRALVAGALAAAAVAVALPAVVPAPAPAVTVVAAAHDVPAGAVLTAGDLVALTLPEDAVPGGALTDANAAVGRPVAGPLRRGEALTDVRLLGAGLLAAGSDVAVPVRLAEPAAGALVQAGDTVDVLAAAPEGAPTARVVASALTVLAVPGLPDDPGEGALVVLAADRGTAARLAAAAVTSRLSLTVHGR